MKKIIIILGFILLLFLLPNVFAIDQCNSNTDCGDNGCSANCKVMICINPTLDNSTCEETAASCSDGSSCGAGKYCCSGNCDSAPSCSGCQYTGTCCSGSSAVCCNYDHTYQCDSTFRCSSGTGDDKYGAGGSVEKSYTVESPHPYPNNYDNTWTITQSGADKMKVHFYRYYIEGHYDHLKILDGAGNEIKDYSDGYGWHDVYDIWSPLVDGDTIKIRLITDSSVTYWGFKVDKYEYALTPRYRCQGYCDGFGNCDYADNCEDCGSDTCYDSGSDWFTREYVIDYESCSGGSCLADIRYNDTCDGDIVHDRHCAANDLNTTDLTKNCNDYDGWYNYGDYGPGCLNMNDPTAEYRDYSCNDGACTYSITSTKDCNSSDGWYGGGNTAGCGSDPSSQKRDYYVNSAGSCTYTTTNCPTKNCDSSDICSNTCDGSVIKSYKDYYVIFNTNTCTYVWGSNVEDCASKNTYESDSCWNYTTGGYIYDYITCSSGSCTYNTYYDSCDGYSLTEYCASGNSYITGTKDCRDYDVAASDSDGDDSSVNGNCDPGKEGYCSNSNPDYCADKSAGSLILDYCSGAGAVGATYKEAIVSDINGNNVYESCTYKSYDPDTNSNTCETCTLNWNLGCSSGDCASSPNTCCGDDSNEYSTSRICNSNACITDSTDESCCYHNNDCVYNNVCYQDGDTSDVDSEGINEYCLAGTWYAYPEITDISKDKSPVDRDDEVDKFTPDTSIKIIAEIYDQDNNDMDKVYITIENPSGTKVVDEKEMICSETDPNHWSCYYNYNPSDSAKIGYYDVKIKGVDKEGLIDEETSPNLFEVKDIYLTNLAHYGTTKDLHITGTAKYTTYDTTVSGANVKCYAEDKICSATTDSGGNFDCLIGELNKNFVLYNQTKTNTFTCEVIDSRDIAGSGTYDIDIGLQAISHNWNDTSLYHDETASFDVTFKNIGELEFAKEHLFWEVSVSDTAANNPESDESTCNGWVDACGFMDDPPAFCGCYKQFDINLAPGDTTTYYGNWSPIYHKFGKYDFGVWVKFPTLEAFKNKVIVANQKIKTIEIKDKPPENLNFVSALPSPVDRDKETSGTNDIITIKVNATDIDGKLGDPDELESLKLSIYVRSDQSNTWTICTNSAMSPISMVKGSGYFYGQCDWNPPPPGLPTVSDSDLGKFDIKFKVDDNLGKSNTSDYSQNEDKFKVEDLKTDFEIVPIPATDYMKIKGNVSYISNNSKVSGADVHCSLNGNIFSSDFNPVHSSHNYGTDITDSNGNFEITIIDPYLSTEREIFCMAQTPTTKIDGGYGFLPNISAEILKVNVTTPCYYWAENITKFNESKWINSSFILGETDNRFAIGNSSYIIIDLGKELPKGWLEVYADSGIDIYGNTNPNPTTLINTTYGSSFSNFTFTNPIRYLKFSKSGVFKIDSILAWSITHDIKYDQRMGINVTVKNTGEFNLSYTRIGINYTQGTNHRYYDPYNFLLVVNKNDTKNFSWPASDFSYGKIDTISHIRDNNVDTNNDSSYGDWWMDRLDNCSSGKCYDGFYILENTQPYEINITWYGNKDNRTIIDRNKENNQTADTIYFNISAKDRDGIYSNETLNITLRFRSDNGTIFTEGCSCNNTEMNHIGGEDYRINCSFNPPNWMENKDLGYFDIEITIVDSGSNKVVSNFNTYPDLFKVEDIKIENLTWSGDTYNLTFSGYSFYLSNNTNLSLVNNQSCVEPEIEELNGDSNLINVRLCGTNNFTGSTCSFSKGNFNCTVIEMKITRKEMNISYVLTDKKNISGYYNLIINLTGNIHYLDILDPDKIVNPKSNVTYIFYISNDGNINWRGYLQNQTRNKISSNLENPLSTFIESLEINNPTSWIDLNITKEGFNINGGDTFCSYVGNSSYTYLQSIKVSDLKDKVIEDISLLMAKNKGCNFTLSILNNSFGLIAGSTNKIIPKAHFNCKMVKDYCPMIYTWHFDNVNVSNYTTIYLNLTSENNCGGDYLFGNFVDVYPNGNFSTDEPSCNIKDIFVYINKFKTLDPENHFHFVGTSNETLGLYNYTGETTYFWPNYNSANLSIGNVASGGKATYRVAAIDITDYFIPNEIIRGDLVTGKIKGYFVGSMDIPYWEIVQAFEYRVTNKTTTGKFWVDKWNKTSKIKTEIPETNMTWNPNFWEAKINTFQLTCDDENTIHRVYFLVNWTDYNIYVPYVKGEFKPEFWPYFYQNFSVKCVSRELFEVNPEIANVALGEKNRNIFNISIQNPKNESFNVDILITAKDYKEVINWLNFTTGTSSCGTDCRKTTISLSANGGGSTIVNLDEAKRVGNYPLEIIVKGSSTGELYRKKAWLNIFSEALGSNNLVYLLLLFFVSILLIKRNYEQ